MAEYMIIPPIIPNRMARCLSSSLYLKSVISLPYELLILSGKNAKNEGAITLRFELSGCSFAFS